MRDHELNRTIRAFFAEVTTLSLATIADDGTPHAANLYFAADDDLNLCFVSDPESAHCRHVASRPTVAVTAFAPVLMWQQIRGVQIHGRCDAVDQADRERALALYLRRFPEVVEIQNLIEDMNFYRIQPRWARWIDNSVKFGYRVERTWPADGE